jgi:hypothetical protein
LKKADCFDLSDYDDWITVAESAKLNQKIEEQNARISSELLRLLGQSKTRNG